LPSDEVLSFVLEAVSDPAEPSQLLTSLDKLISPFLSEKGRGILAGILKGLEPYFDTAGLFGNPDYIERSGLGDLAFINKEDLLKGRQLYRFVLAMANTAEGSIEFLPPDVSPALGKAFSKIARTLNDSDEWCVAGFAACSIAAHRAVGDASWPK
jgi:hypothetical protein